jgi:hypothetical protein
MRIIKLSSIYYILSVLEKRILAAQFLDMSLRRNLAVNQRLHNSSWTARFYFCRELVRW